MTEWTLSLVLWASMALGSLMFAVLFWRHK